MTKLFSKIAVKTASKEAEENPMFKDLEIGSTFKLDSVNPSGKVYMKIKSVALPGPEITAVILADPHRQVDAGNVCFICETSLVAPITVEAIEYV